MTVESCQGACHCGVGILTLVNVLDFFARIPPLLFLLLVDDDDDDDDADDDALVCWTVCPGRAKTPTGHWH